MPLDPRRSPERSRPPDAGGARAGRGAGANRHTPSASPAGLRCLRAALRNVPASPGVYRMLDRKGDALYVGKARNLKSRVQNYTHPAGLSNRLRRMVAETRDARNRRHRHRSRGAAARMQPDQAPDAALQRAAARRQVVSVHSSDRRSRFPAADQVPRRARQGGRLFRALRLGRRGQPHADHVAEGVPAALLQRQRVRQPHAALPAVSDQALQRALRRAHRAARITPRWSTQAQAVPAGRSGDVQQRLAGRDGAAPPKRSISRPRR